MRGKIIYGLILILIFINSFSIKLNAINKFKLELSKKMTNVNEELSLIINGEGINASAGTIWLYFDNEKLEYLNNNENINIVENKIIYTWVSESGKDEKINNLLELKFKTKKEGISLFSMQSELYNSNGEKIETKIETLELNIKNKEKNTMNQQTNTERSDLNSLELEILRLNKEGMVPEFNSNILEYYIVVDGETEELNIIAEPKNNMAKVEMQGEKNLQIGLNKIIIKVSLNGKNKEYIINVTKTDQKEKANTNLETLAIENHKLEPEYNSNILEYGVEINSSDEKLNILAIPESMKAKVEVKNNENLKAGENIIEILVTGEDEITTRKYKIVAYKRNEEEQIKYEENKQKDIIESEIILNNINQKEEVGITKNDKEIQNVNETKELKNNVIIWGGIGLSIIIIVLVVVKLRKKQNS